MEEAEKDVREALYRRISDAVVSTLEDIPDVDLVPPDGFQAITSGLSLVWGQKGTSGVMIHSGKFGLVLDVSVSVARGRILQDVGRMLQEKLSGRLYPLVSEPISAINVDILKIKE